MAGAGDACCRLVDDRRWGLLPEGWLRCGGPDWDAGLHGGGGVVARRPCGDAAGVGRWSCRRIWGRARIQPHSTAITTGDDEGTPCGCLLISLELLPFLTAWLWGAPLRDDEGSGQGCPQVVIDSDGWWRALSLEVTAWEEG
ncbi:hypothetical protein OsJ_01441 [Oryza sativa Japonica Group]|uniref:Uncharacterized protein n=1 Tax=Oryza sativa subsp. japonica TaxID=39947 RepID=A2ZS78_ORYSJ|nr:hypothetical protein OsJ_01441 [Oryza sativa Japonica Group]